MSIGTTLSGTGHAVFLVWMVVGWGLSSDPPPFEVMDVSVVSGADFAAMAKEFSTDPGSGAQGGDLNFASATVATIPPMTIVVEVLKAKKL